MNQIRVLVIDDHEIVRVGIKALIERADDIVVVGMGGTLKEASNLLRQCHPDVVLLDVRLPDADGIEILAAIRERHAELPVVMLSAYDNPTYIARAAAMGATDYVFKGDSAERFVNAIYCSVKGHSLPDDSALRHVTTLMNRREAGSEFGLPLTSRETQVLTHLALGLANKEIAISLSISVETVKEHVQNLLRKLNAADRTDAAVRATKLGLV